MNKCVFTVATGDKYLKFAFALARSYKLHNEISIPFFIISDKEFILPTDLRWVNKKIISNQIMGTGVCYKFNFHEIIPAVKSIFIDADSIVYGNIAPIFDIPNTSIIVIGKKEVEGNWADLPLPDALNFFSIPYVIRYCGAFYYITKNQLTNEICQMTAKLSQSGFTFQGHRTSLNEEPIFSISMAKVGVEPMPDLGDIWTDTVQLRSHNDLNALYKKAQFNNSKQFKYKYWLPEGNYSPLIVHFGGGSFGKNPWVFDSLRLKLHSNYHFSKTIANGIVNNIVKPCYFLARWLKNAIK